MPKRCSGENLFFLVESNQCQQFDLLSSECANIGLMSSIDSLEVGNAVTLMILETEHFSVFSLLCRIWDLWIANGQLWSRKSFVNCRWCLAIMTWKGKPSTEKRKQWLVNNEWYTGLCITNCELKEDWAGNCDLWILNCESWNVNREFCVEAWHCHRHRRLLKAILVLFGALLEPLGSPWDLYWSCLQASGATRGGLLERLGLVLGEQDEIGSSNPWFWGSFWASNQRKNGTKQQQKFWSFSVSIYHSFLISFFTKNERMYEDIVCHCWVACDIHLHIASCLKLS